jgi:L-rhamnose mutarotase
LAGRAQGDQESKHPELQHLLDRDQREKVPGQLPEYTGNDAAKDFASIGLDKTTKEKWWPITDACQKRLPGTPEGEQWLGMERLMHIE